MLHLNQAETIERCTTVRGELKLQRRHNDYEIISNGTFLMATYNGESERLLVDTPVDACGKQHCSVLIGGLGVGYSLGAAVRHPLVAAVTVIEIEERIIAWNRRELAPFSGNALADPKTNIIHADLLEWLPQTTAMFDVICLDIDNGPDWTVFTSNDRLYECNGLELLHDRLYEGGIVSFWSAAPSMEFQARLETVFDHVQMIGVKQPDRLADDVIYVASRR
ncbi:spermine/spermidine synthase [Paenibacillus campi]|uniref:spermidine synthase n=1 Tax=Paenibacillus campi TaxID=3106031 RepID=UPI002B003ABD|nr:spermine/spermidine synthase [Paenibacillus sp. SGZ-1009]